MPPYGEHPLSFPLSQARRVDVAVVVHVTTRPITSGICGLVPRHTLTDERYERHERWSGRDEADAIRWLGAWTLAWSSHTMIGYEARSLRR